MTHSVDFQAANLDALLKYRHSVRGFLTRRIPQATLLTLFETAQQAPSNCNTQPWQVYVASGDALGRLKQALVAEAMAGRPMGSEFGYFDRYQGPHRQRQVACAHALYENMGIARHDKPGRMAAMLRNFEFFGAPHVAFLTLPKDFQAMNALDVGIYLQTLMLVMSSHDVASCAQGALAFYPDVVRAQLGIPEEQGILVGLSFGYEDPAHPANATRTARASLDEVVQFHD